MSEQANTVSKILEMSTWYLQARGVQNPAAVAGHLLSRLVGCKRLALATVQDHVLGEKYLEAMRRGIKRAGAGEPIQYILGDWGFMDHTFKVDGRALIPRPETELLVERMLACDALWATGDGGRRRPRIVDIGTGSGCIVISLAAERPEGIYMGFDVSEEALSLARENAATLGVADRIVFTSEDMADLVEPGSVDAIAANLPYIPTKEVDTLPECVRKFEPRLALDGGPDGLAVIGPVIEEASIMLAPGGFIFMEVGHDQAGRVAAMLKDCGFVIAEVARDLAGIERVVIGRFGD